MSAQHTPEPWKVSNGTSVFYVQAANGRYICKTITDDAQDQANARLIASAPDLLATLIQVRARMAGFMLGLEEEATLQRVNAAIAKATAPTEKEAQ